jgi:hypothetical protein
MLRSFSSGSHRLLLAVVATLLLGLSCAAASASAASTEVNCGNLQSALDTASSHANHGEGEVVVLTGMCDATSLKVKTGVTIPEESNITIEGALGTTSGFDGAGVEQSLLHSAGVESGGALTIRNLTFQHANVTSGEGGALHLQAVRVTLTGNTFTENTLHGFGGGAVGVFLTFPGAKPECTTEATPAGATITNNVFRSNKVIGSSQGAGGALNVSQLCQFPESILEGNVFESNEVETNAKGEAEGGAFSFEPGGQNPTPLLQRANVFDSNRIISTSTTSDFGGGGEWTEGASLMSVGDRFSRNTIPGAGTAKWSWGAGLGILNNSCEFMGGTTESTVEDAAVTGNSIGAGAGDLGGAGIYVGCSPEPANPNHLMVRNTTVTENSVPAGGSAGIDGNPGDQLTLLNSIVSDTGGTEIDGFTGPKGALSVGFSDVCAAGLATPLPGEGNICADPLLADDGNPASFDVHETSASPTIDAGSNALVPASLTTDFFGMARIQSGHSFIPACTPGAVVGAMPAPPVVDMGASEFGPLALPAVAIACPPHSSPPRPGLTHFVRLKTNAKGAALTLSCTSTDGLGCSGTIFITTGELLHGKKVVAVSLEGRKKKSVRLAQTPFSIAAGGTATIQVKLNSTGLKLLRRFHAFSTFLIANEASPTSNPFIFLLHTVRFSEPKPKPKKHHPRRSKHPKHH